MAEPSTTGPGEAETDVEHEVRTMFSAMDARLVGFHDTLKAEADAKIREYEAKFEHVAQEIDRVQALIGQETVARVIALRDVRIAVLKKIQEAGERFHRAFQERLQPFHGQIQDLERQVDEVAAKLDEKRHQFGETIEQNSMAILEKLLEFDVEFRAKNAERFHKEAEVGEEIVKAKSEIDNEVQLVTKEANGLVVTLADKVKVVVRERAECHAKIDAIMEAQAVAIDQEIVKENADRDARYRQIVAEIPVHVARIKNGVHVIS
ncbi:SF-assemblin/beta giardin [Plasmodiophora brassicae]